jgi:hypothetical protein
VSALRGVVTGTLGLSALYVLVSSQQASANVGGAATTFAGAFNRLVDINVPLIPDRRTAAPAAGATQPAFYSTPSPTPGAAPAAPVPTQTYNT